MCVSFSKPVISGSPGLLSNRLTLQYEREKGTRGNGWTMTFAGFLSFRSGKRLSLYVLTGVTGNGERKCEQKVITKFVAFAMLFLLSCKDCSTNLQC